MEVKYEMEMCALSALLEKKCRRAHTGDKSEEPDTNICPRIEASPFPATTVCTDEPATQDSVCSNPRKDCTPVHV
jgi:hypothetical protein